MKIWRIHLRSGGIDPDTFCIDNNLLGVGWHVDGGVNGMNWDDYYELGMKQYYPDPNHKGWWPALNALVKRMKVNDLCWTRDQNETYYLGKVSGDWTYCDDDEYAQAEIFNVRPCVWFLTGGMDTVPGKVLSSFRAQRAVQAVQDKSVEIYSRFLYSFHPDSRPFEPPSDTNDNLNLFSLVSYEDCEDFIGMYLQVNCNYVLIPSSCKKDTKKTEFILKNSDGEKAYVQVKQGGKIDKNEYPQVPEDPRKWFLFSTNGDYSGQDANHIRCFEQKEIEEFVRNNLTIMSSRVQTWIKFLDRFCRRD